MAFWERVKAKAADSAIDYALNAFWVSLTGAAVTGIAALVIAALGLPASWQHVLAGAFWALIAVVLLTSAVTWLRYRRRDAPAPVGRKGFLDFKVEAQRALTANATRMNGITNETARIGQVVTAGALELDRIKASGRDVDERALKSARKTARRVLRHVHRMELHAESFAFTTDQFIHNSSGWFQWAKDSNSTDSFASLLPVLLTLRQTTETSRENMQGFRDSTEAIRNVSQDLDLVNGQLVTVLDTVIGKLRAIEDFCADSVAVLGGQP